MDRVIAPERSSFRVINPDPIETLCRDIAAEMRSRGFDANRAQINGLNANEAHIEAYLACSGIVATMEQSWHEEGQ